MPWLCRHPVFFPRPLGRLLKRGASGPLIRSRARCAHPCAGLGSAVPPRSQTSAEHHLRRQRLLGYLAPGEQRAGRASKALEGGVVSLVWAPAGRGSPGASEGDPRGLLQPSALLCSPRAEHHLLHRRDDFCRSGTGCLALSLFGFCRGKNRDETFSAGDEEGPRVPWFCCGTCS